MADHYALPERIRTKIEVDVGGCWIWTGAHVPSGYGSVKSDGKATPAHRVVYELLVGPVPGGSHLHHECECRDCVNPEHLHVLTPGDHKRLHMAEVTHCPRGHPYDDRNTYWWGGRRYCRGCANDRCKARTRAGKRRVAAMTSERREAINARRRELRSKRDRTDA